MLTRWARGSRMAAGRVLKGERGEGRQPLEIEHKATLVLFSRPWGSLMFEGKGDHPYVEQDVCARGMPGFCGRLRRQRPHRLSKRDFAANGLDVLRDAGKRIKVRSR